jgi:hypothetical protein
LPAEPAKPERCPKLALLQRKTRELIEKAGFSIAIVGLILANTLIMAADHYNESEDFYRGLYYANMVLTILFVGEMLIKIFGLGFKDYLKDGFNIFDAIIIIVGLLEYFGIGNKSVTVLRTFRLLRIFKIVRSWSGLRKLLKTVLASL